ncbi:MAG: sporulation protein YunB [Clostridiales bacterium]|nr:sporulation protein YunB [Clostridiales bacterium]
MKKGKKKIVVLVLTTIFVILIVYFFVSINHMIFDSTKLTLDTVAKKAINAGLSEAIRNRAIYDELVSITHGDDGKISLIQIKSYEANNICNMVVDGTEKNLKLLGNEGVVLTTGMLSNIPILGAFGGKINLKFQQIGTAYCNYFSKFVSAGINQNIHRLYVEVRASIGIVFPFHTEKVDVVQQLLLCENVIIGEVPYTYLQSTELDPLLNLIPS